MWSPQQLYYDYVTYLQTTIPGVIMVDILQDPPSLNLLSTAYHFQITKGLCTNVVYLSYALLYVEHVVDINKY